MQLKSLFTVGFATALTRILGFIRDMLIAAYLGASPIADAFIIAFRLPNLARRVFGEGALNAGFVPLYTRLKENKGLDAALTFTNHLIMSVMSLIIPLALIVMVILPWLLPFFTPGLDPLSDRFELTLLLTRIAFPFLIFSTLAALYSALLNAQDRFTAAAFAPLILNILLILILLLKGKDAQIGLWLALTVSISGFLQAFFLYFAVKNARLSLKISKPYLTLEVKQAYALALPGLIAGGLAQLNVLVGTIIATFEPSAISRLYYADRLYQLPLGVIGVALGIVLLKEMVLSKKKAEDHNRALEMALALALPACLGLIMLAHPIITLLFERGAFNAIDSFETSKALIGYAIGLPFYCLIKVSSTLFFARENTKTPMLIGLVGLVVNGIVAYLLLPHFGASGIAYATSFAGFITSFLMLIVLYQAKDFKPDPLFFKRTFKIILASITMGTMLWSLKISIFIVLPLAILIYLALLGLFGTFDLAEIKKTWQKKSKDMI